MASDSEAITDDLHDDVIGKNGQSEQGKSAVAIRQPRRTIIVEPLVVLMALSFEPLMMVSQLYIYGQFQNEVAEDTGFNVTTTHKNGTTNCEANKSSPEYIFTQTVQSRNAYYNMCSTLTSAVPSIFSILLLSPYSDKAGRRVAILPPVITGFIYALVLFLVIMFKISVWYILIGSFIEGLGGGHQLIFVGIFSYISDTTTMKARRFRITMVELIMFASTTAGPVAFGYWIKHSGYLWPSLFTVTVRFLNIIYAVFFIPETIIKTSQPKFFTVQNLIDGIEVFTKKTGDGRRWRLVCILIAFIITFTAYRTHDVDTLFELNEPLCWNSVTIGYYGTVHLAIGAIGGVVVTWAFKYCASDVITAILAGIMSMANYTFKAFITKTFEMYLTGLFSMFSLLFIPSIRTLMSKLVSPYEQGSVFGALGMVEAIFGFISGVLFSAIYANTLWISSGFVYIIYALFYAAGTSVLIGYAMCLRFLPKRYTRLERFDDDSKTKDDYDHAQNEH